MMSPRTASPRTRPVSVSTPRGDVRAHHRRAGAVHQGHRAGRRLPQGGSGGPRRTGRPPARRRGWQTPPAPGPGGHSAPPRRRLDQPLLHGRLSAVIFSLAPARKHRTCQPARVSSQAAAMPSPPLFPGPANTAAWGRLPRALRTWERGPPPACSLSSASRERISPSSGQPLPRHKAPRCPGHPLGRPLHERQGRDPPLAMAM